VDTRVLNRFAGRAEKALGYAPKTEQDFRVMLQSKDVDAITIATPDHWHAPLAILGLKANKHVYVEKPSSHNCHEGALLVEAQKKYGKCVQVGDQQRSSAYTIELIKKIQDGFIGTPYCARAFYANQRLSMGHGKVAPVPPELNWDLWQGPAPREEYKDNIHPYNWHWLRRYGTGESLNNGTHEVDVCRWALGLEFPDTVTATGGKFQEQDDWEFYDTLTTSFGYKNATLSWDGTSRQGMRMWDRDRGSNIMGTKGSVVLDRDGYDVYDWHGKPIDQYRTGKATSSADTMGIDSMTDAHFANFIDGIQHGAELHSPISIANVSVTMLLLSNISYFTGRTLHLDPANGHIQNDPEAMAQWGRKYEKGWEPTV
jgi:predicted dehydrogenase